LSARGRWVESAGLDWERWPLQVETVIAGHLAGLLEEDRALLGAASVQGEQFVAEVAARVLGWDEEAAVRHLSGPLRIQHRLVEADRLERLASTGQRLSRYRFRHSFVQAGAYRSLDAIELARFHEATARALEAIYTPQAGRPEEERPPALAPELARHFEAAGLLLEAARHHLDAGRWAARLVAYEEATAHLERGLALLEGVAASGERLRLELALCSALVNPQWLRRGWKAPAYQALQRLSDLTQHPDLQDDPQRLAALTVLAQATTTSAGPERGRWVGEELLRLAQGDSRGDRQSLMVAHWALGHGHFFGGQLVAAREHLEQVLLLYEPEAGRPLSPLLVADPAVFGRSLLALVLWLLGYPDQARAGFRQALAQAEAIEQPSSVAIAHLWAGTGYSLLGRDVAAAQGHAAALQPLGEAGTLYGAWIDLSAGQAGAAAPEPALERESTEAAEAGSALQAPGSGVGYAARSLVRARMCAEAGQAEMGLQAMDRALTWIERTGVRVLEAEVWRMRGELLLLADRPGRPTGVDEAEGCFHRALHIARGQQARWLDLRAAVSLARQWQAQGRRDEARELLAGTYGWFTEGFDTVDLVEARALLAELG
jgi:tetratricopeptide (TPR) repeat protein